MTDKLHGATHRIPGVPEHIDQPAGHQGATDHGHSRRHGAPRLSLNHSSARPPRFLPALQRRIAALFGREL